MTVLYIQVLFKPVRTLPDPPDLQSDMLPTELHGPVNNLVNLTFYI